MSKNIQDVNRLIKMLDNQLEAGNSSGTRNEPKRSLKEKDVKDSDGNVDLSGVLDLDLSEEQLNKEIYGGCFDVRVEEVNNTQSENCDTGESEKMHPTFLLKSRKRMQQKRQRRHSLDRRTEKGAKFQVKMKTKFLQMYQNNYRMGEPPIKRKKSTIFIGEDQNKVNKVYANIPEQSQNGEPPRRREKSTRLRILGENKNGGSTNTFEHSQGTGVQQNMQPLEFLQVAKIKRRAWKDEEKRKMMELFGDYIKRKELPSLNNCLEVATVVPELSTRTGQQIRLFVSNEINRRKAAKNHQNGARRSEWTAEETSILQKIFKKYINGELYPSGQEIEEAMKKYPVLANRTNVIIKSKIQYEKKKRKLALNNYL
ncbi:hypothetical protein NQ317_019186 [Molorchus minor]|uniref:Uncharacterized protein n=1 Tax=Molorchus minor TaxID=1323400 RepID=A0ABQ9J5D4_9CUCU|nr:hypothetical protein NQ317_019186 [Molorchus minor]